MLKIIVSVFGVFTILFGDLSRGYEWAMPLFVGSLLITTIALAGVYESEIADAIRRFRLK